MMPDPWPVHQVAALQKAGVLLVEDGNHGEYRPRRNEFGHGETRFIRASNLAGGQVLFETADRINEAAVSRIRKGIGQGGDVLFSHKGTVGKLAVVPVNAPPFVCSPQTTFWRVVDETKADRRFLYYFMNSQAFSYQWRARKGETDMADYVSLTAQRQFEVQLPDIQEQRAIACILGALDDKIELNREMNRTLEAMAQTIFKSWFVDFDPVTAKAAGQEPFGMDADTAALFPDRFGDSELGPIPGGWEVARVAEVASKIAMGPFGSRIKRDNFVESGVPVVRGKNLTDGFVDEGFVYLTAEKATELSRSVARRGDLVFTHRGTLGQVGLIPPWSRFEEYVVSQSQMLFSPDPGRVSSDFMYRFFRDGDGMQQLLSFTATTGVPAIAQPSTNLKKLVLVLPPRSVVTCFAELSGPLDARRGANALESRTLADLRDALLPKLLSGEIRVGQAEKELERAV